MRFSLQQKLGAWALSLLTFFGTLTIPAPILAVGASGMALGATGCTSQEIESAVNSVISGTEAVLKVAEPDIAAKLQPALTALVSAEATWKAGGAVNVIESALNTIAAVTAVIPLTAAYSPLIDVLVAAIEAALALLPSQVKVSAVGNRHVGRVTLAKPSFRHPTKSGAIKAQWNAIAVSSPTLAQALIK